MQYSGLRSGSTFVDGQDRLRTAQPLTQKDRQDSQTNLSDLGPSASQVAASLDMFTLLEKVKQLELEKAELQSQLSNDATTKPGAPSDAEPVNDKVANAPEPADSRPLATPVRSKNHVFHDSPASAGYSRQCGSGLHAGKDQDPVGASSEAGNGTRSSRSSRA